MNRQWIGILGILLLVAAAACGDDDPASTEGGADASADTGGDADAAEDTQDETTEDTTADPNDDADQGGDDTAEDLPEEVAEDVTDTSDVSDEEVGPVEPEFPYDDPCEEITCEAEGEVCVAGGCVGPVDPGDYLVAAAARDASWLSEVQFPSFYEVTELRTCCIDYTGDGEADDGLGIFLSIVGGFDPTFDVTTAVNEDIQADDLTVLVDWIELPEGDGDARLAFLLGTNDVDGLEADAYPVDFETRLLGSEFLVAPESFGETGPLAQFNNGELVGDVLTAGPGTFPLSITVPGLGALQLTLQFAFLEVTFDAEATNPLASVTEPAGGEGYYDHVGGLRLGGVVDMIELGILLDEQLVGARDEDGDIVDPSGGCACAWEDDLIPDDFRFYMAESNGRLLPLCDGEPPISAIGGTEPPPEYTCDETDPAACTLAGILCNPATSLALELSGLPDVDVDRDDIFDGISAGLYGSITGATVIDPAAE